MAGLVATEGPNNQLNGLFQPPPSPLTRLMLARRVHKPLVVGLRKRLGHLGVDPGGGVVVQINRFHVRQPQGRVNLLCLGRDLASLPAWGVSDWAWSRVRNFVWRL